MKKYEHPDIRNVTLTEVMQALSDPSRIKIVRQLLDYPQRPFACNEFPVKGSKATISHHFHVLRQAGLIQTKVEGTKCLTTLRRTEIEKKFPGLWKFLDKSC
jgi:DNA-binding transcriptional ArsR family regulator